MQFEQSYPHSLQCLDLPVEGAVDVVEVEEGIPGDLAEQVSGEVADVVLAEVPLPEHSAGHHGLGVLVAALAEVSAQVLAVAQSLYVVCVRGNAKMG